MDVILTDDEIAAVALDRRLAWPMPFPTVVPDVDHLAAAAARGRRSLLVRGLANPSDSGVEISTDVAETLERAVSARNIAAWVASEEDPSVLAGSSTVIYRQPNGDLVDLTSAIGIHDFRSLSAGDADAIIVALAKNVFDFGFSGPRSPGARLLVGEFGGPSVVLVSAGKIEAGSWTATGFEIEHQSTGWESPLIEAAMQ